MREERQRLHVFGDDLQLYPRRLYCYSAVYVCICPDVVQAEEPNERPTLVSVPSALR